MLFVRGVMRMPAIWQAWVGVLVLVNGIGPLLFLGETVAVVTLRRCPRATLPTAGQ